MPRPSPTRRARARILFALGLVAALLAGFLSTGEAGASIPPEPGGTPAHELPVPCGGTWSLYTWGRPAHSPALDIEFRPNGQAEPNQSEGKPVLASAAGTVKEAGSQSGSGNYVLINHGGGYYSVYIHLQSRPLVSAGQSVARGTQIGYIGHTGTLSNGVPHLHYEQLYDANGDGHLAWGVSGGEDIPAVFHGITYTDNNAEFHFLSSQNSCNGSPPPPSGTPKYWVDTFANAPVYASGTSTMQTGTLYAGTNYVYCKVVGRVISDSSGNHNKYWLKTDPDVGPANQYVSAYYLSRWGNDEAKDNNGTVIPDCPGQTPPPSNTKYWVDTFANAPVYASGTSTMQTGTLYAGTNYVYCKVVGRVISDSSGNHNKYWLKTDPDVGPANQYVSAYYLSRWGNDEAKDNNGTVIPDC